MTATETYREQLTAAIADKYGSHLQFLKASGVYPSTLYHYLEGAARPRWTWPSGWRTRPAPNCGSENAPRSIKTPHRGDGKQYPATKAKRDYGRFVTVR